MKTLIECFKNNVNKKLNQVNKDRMIRKNIKNNEKKVENEKSKKKT